MKRIKYFALAFIIASCNNLSSTPKSATVKDTAASLSGTPVMDTALTEPEPTTDTYVNEYDSQREIRFVVVADTGLNYYTLRDQMFMLHDSLQQPIDTMNRTYNKAKDLIALPEDDEDEMYAGEYYPRRETSSDLSLEYLDVYQKDYEGKSMALVTGIYETKKSADSAARILKQFNSKAFVITANIYMGCMH